MQSQHDLMLQHQQCYPVLSNDVIDSRNNEKLTISVESKQLLFYPDDVVVTIKGGELSFQDCSF